MSNIALNFYGCFEIYNNVSALKPSSMDEQIAALQVDYFN